ncbi:MAG: ABC transporter substrate-binding protein [Ignisphaera sp.]
MVSRAKRSWFNLTSLAIGIVIGITIGYLAGYISLPYIVKPQQPVIAHIKFTLDWAYQGPQAPFLVALYKGFFAEEGLSVTIDRGYGSAKAVSDVAAGVFDMGFGDFNSLVEFKARNPDGKVKCVAIVHLKAPHSIVTLRGKGIENPRDLEGKKLGAPAGDAARRLFPAFAKTVGINIDKVSWVTMDVPLREPMLVKGEVDAVSGFYYTVVLNLVNLNVSVNDVVVFKYADYMPIVGNCILVNEDFLARNPEAVKRFLRAFFKALKYSANNVDEAISIVMMRDPTLNKDLEKLRFEMALELIIVEDYVKRQGLGYVEKSVLEQNIDVIVNTFGLERKPSIDEVIDFSYLPPLEERSI